jgi:hypothetical protein
MNIGPDKLKQVQPQSVQILPPLPQQYNSNGNQSLQANPYFNVRF